MSRRYPRDNHVRRQREVLAVNQVLVKHVEHFEERHIGRNVANLIGDEAARRVCALLPPNPKREIHGYL